MISMSKCTRESTPSQWTYILISPYPNIPILIFIPIDFVCIHDVAETGFKLYVSN